MQRVWKNAIFDQYITLSRKWHKIGHGYYGMQIGHPTKYFQCYYFQWSWTTPNSRSRHMPIWRWLFQKRYEIQTCGILIGTYTRPTQWCHFEWSWVARSIARSLCDSWAFWRSLSHKPITQVHFWTCWSNFNVQNSVNRGTFWTPFSKWVLAERYRPTCRLSHTTLSLYFVIF